MSSAICVGVPPVISSGSWPWSTQVAARACSCLPIRRWPRSKSSEATRCDGKSSTASNRRKQIIGTFAYHFWMKAMTPLTRRQRRSAPPSEIVEVSGSRQTQTSCVSRVSASGSCRARSPAVSLRRIFPVAFGTRFARGCVRYGRVSRRRSSSPPKRYGECFRIFSREPPISTLSRKFIAERQDAETAEMFRMAA